MKRIPGWVILVLVFVVLIGVKMLFFQKKEEKGPQAQAKGKPGAPVSVNYFIVKPFEFTNEVYSSGKIGAVNEIEIKPEVAGKVSAIYFKEGEQVSKGSPLIRLNDADLEAQLMKNKSQLKLSEEKEQRLKKLLAVNGIGQEEYDVQLNEINSLKADQAFINAQIAKTTIAAPFNGVVGLKNISEGAYVSPSQTIASLVQTKPVFIEFSLPEKYSHLLKKGMKVKFSNENSSTKTNDATIYAIEPKIDETTRSLRARAMYEGSTDFYPGMFVKVFVDLGSAQRSLMIPTQSIIPILKGQKVIVSRGGVADEAKVVTGIRTEDKVQVLEGLLEGDTVLTTGLLSVKKGTKLKFIKADK